MKSSTATIGISMSVLRPVSSSFHMRPSTESRKTIVTISVNGENGSRNFGRSTRPCLARRTNARWATMIMTQVPMMPIDETSMTISNASAGSR